MLLTVHRMFSLLSTTTAATTTITTTMAISFATGLPLPPAPPALPALPPYPTRTMASLSLLTTCRVPVLRPGRTTNPARPANLEAELS
jgi:hypothetical protein